MSGKLILKIAAAVLILGVIALRVDFAAAFRQIAGADPLWLAAAIGASLLIIVADAAFWSLSMRPVGLKMEFRAALLFGLVSWFFINIAPSTVGADLFRVAQMRSAGATTERSIRLVAAARLMSFAALMPVIGFGLPYAFSALDAGRDRWALAGLFTVASLSIGGLVAFGPRLARLPSKFRPGVADFAARLAVDTRVLLAKTTPAGWFFLVAQHLLRLAGVVLIAFALHVEVNIAALLALVPAAFLAAMAPITFGGWGVREASFVYFLGVAGVAAPAALAISILFGLTRVLIGAAGGIAWLLTRAEHFKIAVVEQSAHTGDEVKTIA